MNVGLVLFLKAVVVGIWIGIAARWQTYRKKRRDEGLELKPDRRGVYVVSDWTAHVDTAAVWLRNFAFVTLFLWWSVLSLAFLFFGKEGATSVVYAVFGLLRS